MTTPTMPTVPPTPEGSAPTPTPSTPPEVTAALQLGALVATLAQDPQARPEVLKLLRRAMPDVPIPELDIPKQVEERLERTTSSVREDLKKVQEELDQVRATVARKAWAEAKGLTEDDVKEIEALAREKKLPDVEVAWELWDARRARLGTPRPTPGVMEGLTKDDWRELQRHPARWAQRKALDDLAELRRSRRA